MRFLRYSVCTQREIECEFAILARTLGGFWLAFDGLTASLLEKGLYKVRCLEKGRALPLISITLK